MSIETNSLLVKLQQNATDLHSQFSNIKKLENKVIKGTLNWLGQHGEPYFSPYRACFLFELSSLQSLDYFSPLQSRDGVATLLQFFFKNPRPLTSETILLVNDRFENLIPANWIENCLLYKKVSKNIKVATTPLRKLVLLNSALGRYHCSQDFMNSVTEKLSSLKDQFEKVVVVNFSSSNLDRNQSRDLMVSNQFETFLRLNHIFNGKIEIKAPQKILFEDLSNSCFLDLNELNFYYSDSAIENSLFSLGAKPLFFTERSNVLHETDLSFFHKIQFFKPEPRLNNEATQIQKLFQNSPSLQEVEKNHKPTVVDSEVKIISQVFEDYAFDLAQKAIAPIY